MQETNDLEIGGVLKKLVDSSPKALEHNLVEGLLVFSIGGNGGGRLPGCGSIGLCAAGSGRDAGG